jgi:hypothetical protein
MVSVKEKKIYKNNSSLPSHRMKKKSPFYSMTLSQLTISVSVSLAFLQFNE